MLSQQNVAGPFEIMYYVLCWFEGKFNIKNIKECFDLKSDVCNLSEKCLMLKKYT